jgi:hypothetical protein
LFTKLISHPATLGQDLIGDLLGRVLSVAGLALGPDKYPFVSRKLLKGSLAAFNRQGCLRAHIDAGTAEGTQIIGQSHLIYNGDRAKGAGFYAKTTGIAFFGIDFEHRMKLGSLQ